MFKNVLLSSGVLLTAKYLKPLVVAVNGVFPV